MNTEDYYSILMERLDFAGSARLRHIMEGLITPDQARMVVVLPGTPQEVAEKTGITLSRVIDNLDDLFFKGVIFPRGDFRKREYYRFARSIGQFHDATMATEELDVVEDREYFELWHDFVMNEMYPRERRHRTDFSLLPDKPACHYPCSIHPHPILPMELKMNGRVLNKTFSYFQYSYPQFRLPITPDSIYVGFSLSGHQISIRDFPPLYFFRSL